ncbi:hypothetical protein [Kineosporia mesophila]|uniref:hypothetical protein n=1 Tax=Kineosporia mesophila TaxID=566012 RepID=UPI001E5530AA|nr:hypothetical protein [Kineosporia mesophila]MCD5350658.1 hypothetical protein [Kineosporia mesophila]
MRTDGRRRNPDPAGDRAQADGALVAGLVEQGQGGGHDLSPQTLALSPPVAAAT